MRTFSGLSLLIAACLVLSASATAQVSLEVKQRAPGCFSPGFGAPVAAIPEGELCIRPSAKPSVETPSPVGDTGPTASDQQAPPLIPETHAIGIYTVDYVRKADGRTLRGEAIVAVDRPGVDVTLVLASYDPVLWDIRPGRDTRIVRVILGGFHADRSDAVVDGEPMPVEISDLKTASDRGDSGFRKFLKDVATAAGVERADSVDVAHRAPGAGFLIADAPGVSMVSKGDLLKDARPRATLPEPLQVGMLDDPFATRWSFDHDGFTRTAFHKTTTKFPPDRDLPLISHPTGIALDKENTRLWGITRSGEGFLFEYHVGSDQWSARSLQGRHLLGLQYDAATDQLVTRTSIGREPVFASLTAQGHTLRTVPIPISRFNEIAHRYDAGLSDRPDVTMLAAHDSVLLISVEHQTRTRKASGGLTLHYVIDLRDGAVELVR
jgi:hypothetical protein